MMLLSLLSSKQFLVHLLQQRLQILAKPVASEGEKWRHVYDNKINTVNY